MMFSSLFPVILVATIAIASPLKFKRDDDVTTVTVPSISLKRSFKRTGDGVTNDIITRDEFSGKECECLLAY